MVEHADRFERHVFEAPAEPGEFRQQVRRHGDDVAADRFGLDHVEDLAEDWPRAVRGSGTPASISTAAAIDGTGSRPVSAIRPAKTGTTAPRLAASDAAIVRT